MRLWVTPSWLNMTCILLSSRVSVVVSVATISAGVVPDLSPGVVPGRATAFANPVLRTEGRVTLVDAYLAGAVLVGLVLNALLGWVVGRPAGRADHRRLRAQGRVGGPPPPVTNGMLMLAEAE